MPTPEDDYRMAREALLSGDHAHAARHLAGALSTDPLRGEWLLCLDQIVADAPAPAELIPERKGMWFGEAAVRARLLWTCGKPEEALSLIVQVAAVKPELRYLAWAAEWADNCAAQLEPSFAIAFIDEVPDRLGTAATEPILTRLRKRPAMKGSARGISGTLLLWSAWEQSAVADEARSERGPHRCERVPAENARPRHPTFAVPTAWWPS